jgi:hypothetical protein
MQTELFLKEQTSFTFTHRMSEAAQNSKPEPLKNTSTFIKFTTKETSRAMGLRLKICHGSDPAYLRRKE